jgi:hypothetical protein
MAMNPLPPQAYTKETLLRAYQWLQNQNDSIKEMATTPDILVSLYLKATRDGDSALERPSITNFKNELRNLAGLMGDLEKQPQQMAASPRPAETFVAPPVAPQHVSPQFTQPVFEKTVPVAHSTDINFSTQLDELSMEMLQEIKNGFNLSSQSEALRLLIKLGYLKARKILAE